MCVIHTTPEASLANFGKLTYLFTSFIYPARIDKGKWGVYYSNSAGSSFTDL